MQKKSVSFFSTLILGPYVVKTDLKVKFKLSSDYHSFMCWPVQSAYIVFQNLLVHRMICLIPFLMHDQI